MSLVCARERTLESENICQVMKEGNAPGRIQDNKMIAVKPLREEVRKAE